jgi:hydroxyethylthiazole kinase
MMDVQTASHAIAVMGIAGQITAGLSAGPGSLQLHFLDILYRLAETEITTHLTCLS